MKCPEPGATMALACMQNGGLMFRGESPLSLGESQSSAEEAAFQLGPWDLNLWNPRKGHFQRQKQDRLTPGSRLSCRAPQSRAGWVGAVMEEGEPWCQSGLSANLGDASRPPAALWLQWVDGLDSNPASTHGGLCDLRPVSEPP